MMNLHPIAIGISLLSISAMLGCGKGTSATEDPLTGTWQNDACFGSPSKPSDIESCSVEVAFLKSLDFQLTARWISLAATAVNPGCTTTRRITGQTWSTNHEAGTLTLIGRGDATLERSACVDEKDNVPPEPTTDIEARPGDMSYEVGEDTLRILTGSLQGTYQR